MSWFPERNNQTWLQKICAGILKAGPIPNHVAFIMDGNRRFATKNSIDRAQGHLQGFNKLAQTLEWCLDLGISEVTVYAFSIENFKRSKDEVDCLMELARQKFSKLLHEKEMIEKHGICIRVLGQLTLLPQDIQETIAEAVYFTKHNTRAILNVCFAYTARDDICTSMREMTNGVKQGIIKQSDINEELLEKCLYTSQCRKVDILIRTSGEVRLSDFLLWESAYTCLAFVKVLWPEFSIWHLYAAVLHYQRNSQAVEVARQNNQIERERLQRESDHKCILEELEEQMQIKGDKSRDTSNFQSKVAQYAKIRNHRVQCFVDGLNRRRAQYFEKLTCKN
ncbi:dehydrodolichyl diphosphate synthase complex subunit DHDDS isoform X2 [Patella vulgata]|uniref:dehydrodolichyl diphosphate synthase complex subunit DHDDS isoform X2 n=1 Tax=Patella vulgata TaxID=6465 RepID=UPI00217FABFE|nr:dehydrodolichyl diphosphate synthase complex subunit DHDDS isoform X2 [Patella vulgata]